MNANGKSRMQWVVVCVAAGLMSVPGIASADPGDPVAIRCQENSVVIESMWNLSVIVPDVERHDGWPKDFDQTLDRKPDADDATWSATEALAAPSSNAIRVRKLAKVIVIDIDGLRIVYSPVNGKMTSSMLELVDDADVLIVPSEAHRAVAEIDSAMVVVPTDDVELPNTVAVREGDPRTIQDRFVRLSCGPTVLADELETLLAAKEKACKESQQVFANLSTRQMNFRPSNGSHTPRWNAEHMMGRELLFFSQIYAAQDPSIPVIDLNPNQMPPDYIAKHADWSGREEARQMERVSAFTRRFAYLLKDLPMDEKLQGSRWTLRGLLEQMDRHYTEHTANVLAKNLPDR